MLKTTHVRRSQDVSEIVGRHLQPLRGTPRDYDPLLRLVGDARFVLVGEASNGSHEFYAERATITRGCVSDHAAGCVSW